MKSNGVMLLEEQGVLVVIRGVELFLVEQATRKCFSGSLTDFVDPATGSPRPTQVTCCVGFQPLGDAMAHAAGAATHSLALLLLVDERKLMYLQVQMASQTLQLVGQLEVPRNATCMAVTTLQSHQQVVVIGEKTGEVVLIDLQQLQQTKDANQKPVVHTLLGHTTSMITDLCFNHDNSLLLTADRDEKVRVSHFPSTCVIAAYCLGHKASVSQVVCNRHRHPQLALSVSMDQTIKLWQLESGKCLDSKPISTTSTLEPAAQANAADAKAFAKASIVWSETSDRVLVLVPHQPLLCFDIVASRDGPELELCAVPLDAATQEAVARPCAAKFLASASISANEDNETVAFAYTNAPFYQQFQWQHHSSSSLTCVPPDAAMEKLLQWCATAEVPELLTKDCEADANAAGVDEVLDGVQKKKIKTKY